MGHTINSQKCTMKPNTRCIKLPKVVPVEECESKTINNCREVPSRECLTIYKTECSGPERQDICFNTDKTVCSKKAKKKCFDIPATTCEKVAAKKCFTVATPPKLVRVPKSNCGGDKPKPSYGEDPTIHHIHIAQPQVHHAPSHSHQTHFVPSVATATPVVAT